MKLKSTLFLLLFYLGLNAQDCATPTALLPLQGNNISALTSNGGDLFWDGFDGRFIVPADDINAKTSIFAAGLWIGGFDLADNIKIAAQTYGRSNGKKDYVAGPLKEFGVTTADDCAAFDKIWSVTKQQVDAHLADFEDNGVIDNPNAGIYGWPGRDNAFFEQYNGFSWPTEINRFTHAPFWDLNGNDIYEPDQGEYPHHAALEDNLFPTQLTYTIFNDATIHSESNGDAVRAEIQLCTWNFSCPDNEVLDNTVFVSYTIQNASIESIDSTFVGLWVDFDLGCVDDDYIGSAPDQNAFFVYNQSNSDGFPGTFTCQFGENSYEENPPAQSVTFLNRSLDKFTYYLNGALNPPLEQAEPQLPHEFYNYLTGSWRDGTPFTTGGTGYNPSSTDVADHAFPGDPNDPSSWALINETVIAGDYRVLGSHQFGELVPGQYVNIDMAFTFHRQPGLNHLENVTQMYEDIADLQQSYDSKFADACSNSTLSNQSVIPPSAYQFSPNPTTGLLDLQLGVLELEQIRILDLSGRELRRWGASRGRVQLDISNLPTGMYLMQLQTQQQSATEKLIKI
ncbi:MAG: T9SS type A sorting domain-containing protein [Bacteroidota bacterium]